MAITFFDTRQKFLIVAPKEWEKQNIGDPSSDDVEISVVSLPPTSIDPAGQYVVHENKNLEWQQIMQETQNIKKIDEWGIWLSIPQSGRQRMTYEFSCTENSKAELNGTDLIAGPPGQKVTITINLQTDSGTITIEKELTGVVFSKVEGVTFEEDELITDEKNTVYNILDNFPYTICDCQVIRTKFVSNDLQEVITKKQQEQVKVEVTNAPVNEYTCQKNIQRVEMEEDEDSDEIWIQKQTNLLNAILDAEDLFILYTGEKIEICKEADKTNKITAEVIQVNTQNAVSFEIDIQRNITNTIFIPKNDMVPFSERPDGKVEMGYFIPKITDLGRKLSLVYTEILENAPIAEERCADVLLKVSYYK